MPYSRAMLALLLSLPIAANAAQQGPAGETRPVSSGPWTGGRGSMKSPSPRPTAALRRSIRRPSSGCPWRRGRGATCWPFRDPRISRRRDHRGRQRADQRGTSSPGRWGRDRGTGGWACAAATAQSYGVRAAALRSPSGPWPGPCRRSTSWRGKSRGNIRGCSSLATNWPGSAAIAPDRCEREYAQLLADAKRRIGEPLVAEPPRLLPKGVARGAQYADIIRATRPTMDGMQVCAVGLSA